MTSDVPRTEPLPSRSGTRPIFISYRPSDSAIVAGRVAEHLASHLGHDSVFFDPDSLQPGTLYREWVASSIVASSAVIALIGPHWLTGVDTAGARRIDDPNDIVRQELEIAFANAIPIVPVLLHGATMPEIGDLPASLAPLTQRNAIPLRSDPDYQSDIDRLLRAVLQRGRRCPTCTACPVCGRDSCPGDTGREGTTCRKCGASVPSGDSVQGLPPVQAPAHQEAALPLHLLIVCVFGVLGLASVGVGAYAIAISSTSETVVELLGAKLSTGNAGVALIFIGLAIAMLTVRAVLRNQRELGKLPQNSLHSAGSSQPNAMAYRFITSVLVAIVAVSVIGLWLFLEPRSFDLRVRFVSEAGSLQTLNGMAKLLLGAEERQVLMRDANDALFQGIPSRWKGRPLRLSLETVPFRIADRGLDNKYATEEAVDIVVIKDAKLVPYYAGTVTTPAPSKRIAGAQLALEGTPCAVVTDKQGYFAFSSCEPAERLTNPRVSITLPGEAEPCPELVNLQPLPRMSDLTIASDCRRQASNPAAKPIQPEPGSSRLALVPVPDLLRSDADKAAEVIRNSGLRVGTVTRRTESAQPRYSVLAQSPQPGSMVPRATDIDLTLAAPTRVPLRARYDAMFKAPACLEDWSVCETGTLLFGSADTESNHPNTIVSACPDGDNNSHLAVIESIRLTMNLNNPYATASANVLVQATVRLNAPAGRIRSYFAADARNPEWSELAPDFEPQTGQSVVSLIGTIFKPGLHALRLAFSAVGRGGQFSDIAPGACASGPDDDNDDLVFRIG